ncbi:MAG: hypothetical protein ABI151_16725 [Chitinophagaceae bacterium]
MKRILPLLAACILSGASCFASSRFWIGSATGNWNNPANWAVESEGAPGASIPGVGDDVFFDKDAVVLMDGNHSVNSLTVTLRTNVTLYTSVAVSLTISSSLNLAPGSMLKDSTSQPVSFPVIFNPATNAGATIQGFWIFAGNNTANIISEEGANFIAGSTNRVKVLASSFAGAEGKIISGQNAGNIIAADSALEFANFTYFQVDGDLNPTIPNAKWGTGSKLIVNGNVSTVTHGAAQPFYGTVTINLSNLTQNAGFALPDGSEVKGLFSITNTNGYTLSLLSALGAGNKVEAILRNSLLISDISTNVALATAIPAAPQINYQLAVSLDLLQSGGNISLQDFNGVTGTSSLVVGRHIRQTAGTFITKSTATGTARFVVDMNFNVGSMMNSDIEQLIKMSSGSIDNPQHSVTLKINSKTEYTGVTLQSPLSTGRIEFVRGPLTTTTTNILTINDTDTTTAVKVGIANGYVNGPVRISTNSTHRYILPTGKNSLVMNAAFMIPSNTTLSVYQAEYFRNGYSDVNSIGAPLTGISTNKYWNIEKISGSEARVQLELNGAVDGAGVNDVIVVGNYANSQWVGVQGTVQPGTATSGAVVSRNLNSYGAFTFGYINFGLGALPVKLVSFDAVKKDKGASIDWKAEAVSARFEVQRSTDGKNFSTIGSVVSVVTKSQYSYFDASLPQGTIYYRLQSVEKDGSTSFSKMAIIVNKEMSASQATMYPTLVISQARFSISDAKGGRLDVMVSDMQGRVVKQLQLNVTAGSFETTMDLSALKSGVYQVTGVMNGLPVTVNRFVKN